MFESTSYEEIKEKFDNHCTHGWNHIEMWIVSPDFYQRLINDKNHKLGARVRIREVEEPLASLKTTNTVYRGYEIIVSDGFSNRYGIDTILRSNLSESNLQLLNKNISHNYQ